MIDSLLSKFRKAGEAAGRAAFAVRVLERTGFLGALSPTGIAEFARGALDLRPGPHLALILHARNKPEKIAAVEGRRRVSYGALDHEINQLGHALVEYGITVEDRIALMLPNCIQYVVAQQTIARVGATSVQIGTRLKSREIAHILQNAEPALVFVHRDFLPQLEHALQQDVVVREEQVVTCGAGPEDSYLGVRYEEIIADRPGDRPPATGSRGGGIIIYTSGTTGHPKGAARDMTQTSLEPIGDLMARMGMTHDDRQLVVCPLYHSAAPAFASMSLALGGTVVLQDRFDPERVLDTIQRESITGAFMVPTMLARLADLDESIRRKYDLSSLRWILSGAAPLPSSTARRFQESFGRVLWNFYGSTETGLVTMAGPDDHEARPGTVGTVLRGNEVRVVDEEGYEVPVGEVGELYVRNEMLISGYHRDRESTRRAMADGFFSVGDMARVDEDRFYYIESRKHDMVISGGVNIYPREVENHLEAHPDIEEAAVVGIADAEWGESLRAFVVRRPGSSLSEQQVISFCRHGLADFKRPRSVVFLDTLPRTPTGKILKRDLRHR